MIKLHSTLPRSARLVLNKCGKFGNFSLTAPATGRYCEGRLWAPLIVTTGNNHIEGLGSSCRLSATIALDFVPDIY